MSKFNLRGKLTMTVHSCRNLKNRELLGKMDPFCEVRLSGGADKKFKTKVVKDGHQNPVFEQSYIFNLEGKEELLHLVAWNEATLGNDHIGRLDLSLDKLDLSGQRRWYQLCDRNDFTKQTGEVQMSFQWDGIGLPPDSDAHKSHTARVNAASPSAAASPASPVQQQAASAPPATVAPPVMQQQQPAQYNSGAPSPYASQQPNYQQPPPPQQVAYSAPPQQQPQYASQYPGMVQQQPQQPVYATPPPQQPMYAAPPQQQPMYAAPPQQPMYGSQQAPPMYVSQQPAPVYAPPQQQYAPVVAPVYPTQPGMAYAPPPQQPMYAQQPQVQYQPPQTTVIYQQMPPRGQIIGYFPNGQPRYAGQ